MTFEIQGEWQLIGSASMNSEVEFTSDDEPDPGVVSGRPEVYWFDEEGVLQAQVTPFNGVVAVVGSTAYLRPASIAKWAEPEEGRYAPAVLRHDDGDTKISDRVQILSERLVRTVNIVTDELYLDRVVIIYGRGATVS